MKSTILAMSLVVLGLFVAPGTFADSSYVPTPVFCASGANVLCGTVPAFIGPDKALGGAPVNGYFGIRTPPIDADRDVQSPFDNMAWQMFVGLNWRAGVPGDPGQGLTTPGTRVWQTWPRVENVFGPAPSAPSCFNPLRLPTFTIASDGKGNPSARDEEYLQASTNLPLIDVNGNWTVFERRLDTVEADYLANPIEAPGASLTTLPGQQAFLKAGGVVAFPESAPTPVGWHGAFEIKAAWRILDTAKGDDPSRYFTMRALLQVSGELVEGKKPICAPVTLGLVGMHMIQKTPPLGKMLAEWIWASFEHVDNAPPAQTACDPTGDTPCAAINQQSCGAGAPDQTTRYSYFDRALKQPAATNVMPVASNTAAPTAFQWSRTEPYARAYQQTPGGVSPQAVRCWNVYSLTSVLNDAWRAKLRQANSVFANYMLIGTQWGGNVEPVEHGQIPDNAVPGLLSNITLETYIQNLNTGSSGMGPGSCIGCHSGGTLPNTNASSNFSFLPFLAQPLLTRPVLRRAP